MTTIIDDFIHSTLVLENLMIEKRIRIILKPAPKFIPKSLWIRLASKFILIAVGQTTPKSW